MNRNDALEIVKAHLPKKRFEHTVRVTDTAIQLADKYGVSKQEVELAAIFHDYAKFRPKNELKRWITNTHLPKDLLFYHHQLWHGPVGAILIEREQGIQEPAVQAAIYCHTTGKKDMSPLDLILYVADYMEPGRSFPGLDEVREMAKEDLVKTAWMISRNTIQFLMGKSQPIYPDTFHAYNDLTKKINGGNR